MQINTANDYLIWDNIESITYTSNNVTDTAYQLAITKRRSITSADVPTEKTGSYTSSDLVWMIPTAVLTGGLIPKVSDYITDSASVEWTVLDLQLWNFKSTWRLTTRNLVLAEGLYDTIKLMRPANTNDGAGGRVTATYAVVHENVQCKIIEVTSDAADLFGRKTTKQRFDLHSSRQLLWKATDRIVDQNNVVYGIVSGAVPFTLNSLQVFSLEKIL